ncbi:MAG: DNA-3-methyladenine glycosylase [Bacillota bacterium]
MKLPRAFYCRDTLTVTRELLGKHLVHDSDEGKTTGKIVEVEAYMGPGDAAAHSYKGIRSSRTRIQYGPGGYAYIFLIYGMYYCFNIVTSVQDRPEVVLVRALEPVDGIDLMKKRRRTDKTINLCNGPGKLCTAMGITARHYGADLCGDELYLTTGEDVEDAAVEATPRINIDYAGEAKHYLWRYVIKGSKFVSKP